MLTGPWRPGDQRYYVSDTRAYEHATGWRARVRASEGIARLYEWLQVHRRPQPAPLHAVH